MSLKAILDSLDGLPPDVAKEYEEKDGKFYLIVEDDIKQHPKVKAVQVAWERGKARITELTQKITDIEAKLAEMPADFDPVKYAEEQDELVALRAKKKKGGEEPDPEQAQQKKLYEQRITTLTTKLEGEKAALATQVADLVKQIERLVADDGLTKALVAAGVEKKLMPGATALLRRSVKVRKSETGEWVGFIESDLGESSIEDFVGTWAQSDEGAIYIAKAKGGNGAGGEGNRQVGGENPWDTSNGKKANLTKQQEMVKANPEKARQLATQAGARVTW